MSLQRILFISPLVYLPISLEGLHQPSASKQTNPVANDHQNKHLLCTYTPKHLLKMQLSIAKIGLIIAIGMTNMVSADYRCCKRQACTECSVLVTSCNSCTNVSRIW